VFFVRARVFVINACYMTCLMLQAYILPHTTFFKYMML